jgi:hypothetical protein
MNVIDRDLENIKRVADALAPHSIHVIECKGHEILALNLPHEINGVKFEAGQYAKLQLILYLPLSAKQG